MMQERQPEDQYAKVTADLLNYPDVTVGGSKGFGSSALKIRGKIFAMLSSGDKFVVKLPRQRVESLIAAGEGERFDANHGRWMREWVTIPVDFQDKWLMFAKEALDFVGSLSND